MEVWLATEMTLVVLDLSMIQRIFSSPSNRNRQNKRRKILLNKPTAPTNMDDVQSK